MLFHTFKKSLFFLSLVGLVSMFAALSVVAQSQETELVTMSFDDLLNATVEVGTRRPDKKLQNSLVPVDTFNREQLLGTGYQDLGKALQRLLPYVNRPQPSITDGTDHAPPTTLRGMEPDQTLVLINGKRLHQSALVHLNGSIGRGSQSVDLQTIPMGLIERVEILRDGAAAQYGSDAIAGIINIVLSKKTALQLRLNTGVSAQSDGEQVGVAVNKGWTLPNDGFVTISLSLQAEEPTNRANPDPREQYFMGDPRNEEPALQNPVNHRFGQPKVETTSFALNSEFSVTDNLTGVAFGHWHVRDSEAGGFFRRPRDNRNVREIYPDGFLPLIDPEITDVNLNIGVKNKNAETWQWEVSDTYGVNEIHYFVEDSLNTSLGLDSPVSFDSGKLRYWQNTLYVNGSRELTEDWFLALGAELRYENYEIIAGEPASYIDGGVPVLDGPNAGSPAAAGAQVFPGFQPENAIDESRTNFAAYADIETDLTDNWQAQLAIRYEDNEKFGSSLDGKLATGYQINENLQFRVSTSTGFRAPSLGQSVFSAIAALQDSLGNIIRAGTFPVEHPVALALGAKPLQAEESTHIASGFSWQISPEFKVMVDWFYTEVDDRIALTGNIRPNESVFGSEVVGLLEDLSVSQARFFSNTFNTRTKGWDIVLQHSAALADIKWVTDLRYHANDTDIVGAIRLPETLANINPSDLFSLSETTRVESAQPGENINLNLSAHWQNLTLNNRLMKFASITVGDSDYPAEWVWDVDVRYQALDNVDIQAGIHNVNNNFPANTFDNGSVFRGVDGIFPYSTSAPFGYTGRYYYVQVQYRF